MFQNSITLLNDAKFTCFTAFNSDSTLDNLAAIAGFPSCSANLSSLSVYNAAFDADNSSGTVERLIGYRAANTVGTGTGPNYGYWSELENTPGKDNYNFFASGGASNFFRGMVYQGPEDILGLLQVIHWVKQIL